MVLSIPPNFLKRLCLLLLFACVVLTVPALAYSPLIELNPKRQNNVLIGFEIHAEPVTGGDVKFTVKLSERSMKFREKWFTSLSKVHVTDHSMEAGGIRKLPAEREGDTITCIFTVTPQELADPDISFYFGMPDPGHPNIDHFYAPLKNFLPK